MIGNDEKRRPGKFRATSVCLDKRKDVPSRLFTTCAVQGTLDNARTIRIKIVEAFGFKSLLEFFQALAFFEFKLICGYRDEPQKSDSFSWCIEAFQFRPIQIWQRDQTVITLRLRKSGPPEIDRMTQVQIVSGEMIMRDRGEQFYVRFVFSRRK